MGNLSETLPIVLAAITLFAVIGIFVRTSIKLRKGGGSMTTVVIGATDQFLTKDRLRAAETIIVENAGENADEVNTEGMRDATLKKMIGKSTRIEQSKETRLTTSVRRTPKKESSPGASPDLMNELTFEPVTRENWSKFTVLFGERGACGNCWCMYYRLSKADFVRGKKNDGNRNAMRKIVWSGKPVGLLAMLKGEAIGWLALAPREDFLKLEKSRVHKRIDDRPVWSIPCFFIGKSFRRRGLSVGLLKGAIKYADSVGIEVLEAYPTIPTQKKWPDSFLWVGLYKSFERAGFEIVDRASKSRPMVRYYVSKGLSPK